jgi:hypothetical protein
MFIGGERWKGRQTERRSHEHHFPFQVKSANMWLVRTLMCLQILHDMRSYEIINDRFCIFAPLYNLSETDS